MHQTAKHCILFQELHVYFEPSASITAAQNGVVERSRGVIVTKAKAMSIRAKLSNNLWKEVVDASTYLHHRTPRTGTGPMQ